VLVRKRGWLGIHANSKKCYEYTSKHAGGGGRCVVTKRKHNIRVCARQNWEGGEGEGGVVKQRVCVCVCVEVYKQVGEKEGDGGGG